MPSLNSSRFAGRPTTHGQQVGLRHVPASQPTAEELRRKQLQRAAALMGVKIPESNQAPVDGQRNFCDNSGRNRGFTVEVRRKKVIRKPHWSQW